MKGERLGEFEEFTLLAVRALGDHTYAVPVQQFVEDATGRNVSLGAVYAALARLESKGFVRSSMAAATARRGGKSRRLYEVTLAWSADRTRAAPCAQEIWTTIAEGRQS